MSHFVSKLFVKPLVKRIKLPFISALPSSSPRIFRVGYKTVKKPDCRRMKKTLRRFLVRKSSKKPGILQNLKALYKEHFYILVSVHSLTSLGWFGSFYYLVSRGFDLKIFKGLDQKKTGTLALAYALFKIFSPLRYSLTLASTMLAIKILRHHKLPLVYSKYTKKAH